jgi:anti-sigma regulatory factor (Ser/Thr protein kinase)
MLREQAFEADLDSVGAARRFVTAELALSQVDLDVALLLVSELATNAICHARSRYVVRLRLHPPTLRVEVEDQSLALPVLRPVDPSLTSGRGIWLLERLASAWGTDSMPGGKRIWFEQPSAG